MAAGEASTVRSPVTVSLLSINDRRRTCATVGSGSGWTDHQDKRVTNDFHGVFPYLVSGAALMGIGNAIVNVLMN